MSPLTYMYRLQQASDDQVRRQQASYAEHWPFCCFEHALSLLMVLLCHSDPPVPHTADSDLLHEPQGEDGVFGY